MERMPRRRILTLAGAGSVLAWTTPVVTSIATPAAAAGSGVPIGSGGTQYLPPGSVPSDVRAGRLESNDGAFVWFESGPHVLGTNLAVDRVSDGVNFRGTDTDPGAVIPAGTRFSVYMVHGDAIGAPGTQFVDGGIVFPGPIVGLVYRAPTLAATNGFAAPGVTLGSGGLESSDRLTLDGSDGSLDYNLRFGGGVDLVRVFVLS
jgi:hypothetical protein